MVSSNDSIIVRFKNSIITKINTLIGNHNNSSTAHSDIRGLVDDKSDIGHSHGDITNTGAIGTVANKPLITSTNGKIATGSFGTSANTFAEGNHNHDWDEINYYDNPTGWTMLESDGAYTLTAIGISYDTFNDVLTFPSTNLYDGEGVQLAKISDIPSTSNFITKGSTTNLLLANGSNIAQSTFATSSHTHGNVTNDGKIGTASGKLITTGTGGALQASDSITKSMISDFPSSMTPTSHTHGNISDGGNIGTASGKPIITGTKGVLQTGSFGTTAGTFCQGNDSRLSNARTPTAHTHTKSDITDFLNAVYPIGAIYISVNNTSPATLFGGTWVQIKDTFLYATSGTADTGNTATAGSKDAVIVEHNHSYSNGGEAITVAANSSLFTNGFGPGVHWNNTKTNIGSINKTGESGTGKNMPPYMKVYMWKRTA